MIRYLENEADFNKLIAEGDVVVDFFATWCGPCKMMGRLLEEIESDYPDITFLKVDTDRFQNLAIEFDVVSIPTLIAFKQNKRVNFINSLGDQHDILLGAQNHEDFRDYLDSTF